MRAIQKNNLQRQKEKAKRVTQKPDMLMMEQLDEDEDDNIGSGTSDED